MSATTHNAFIDFAKAVACTAIVWHHLAFYGPISDTLHAAAPALSDWLITYGRMAVQIFLVIGGYLAVASLTRPRATALASPWRRIGGRFERLVIPYYAALVVVVLVNAAVQPWLDVPDMVGEDPSLWQIATHLVLLNGLLGQESLSAGVWYVAIDFQLFALATLLLLGVPPLLHKLQSHADAATRHVRTTGCVQALAVAGVALSLFGFNRDGGWDNWALYFFGAYGLGMLAWWSTHATTHRAAWGWAALIALLTAAALWLDWRDRILLAGTTALLLSLTSRAPALSHWCQWRPIGFLARVSYCVFLVHFAFCLAANALVANLWPDSVAAAVLAMMTAYGLSLVAGWLLHRAVEVHAASWRKLLGWEIGLVGAGLATTLIG